MPSPRKDFPVSKEGVFVASGAVIDRRQLFRPEML